MTSDRLDRQRPDGLLLNWRTRTFYVLEFTRAYDPDLRALQEVDAAKSSRYTRLCTWLRQKLRGWSGEVVPLTVGIRGTMDQVAWQERLSKIGVPQEKRQALLLAVLKATLAGLDTMFLARNSQLQPEQSVAQSGLPRPGNPDNPDPPGAGGPGIRIVAESTATTRTTTTATTTTTAPAALGGDTATVPLN
jgi:hypothetical protein